MKPTPESVSAAQVAEVKAFLKVERALAQLKKNFPTAFEKLLRLQPQYNAALEAAQAVLKAKKVGCGPFDLYEFAARRNMAAFVDAVGKSEFVRLGGEIKPSETFVFDAKRFDALVVAEKISPEVEARVVAYDAKFHAPKPISIP